VSKRLGSRYRSGRSPDWLKMKNPDAPASSRVISATVKNNSTEMKAAREGLQLAA
jgi:ATP-dependent DNA ligase